MTSVIFDSVNLEYDKFYLAGLLNVNYVQIKNSKVDLKKLKGKIENLRSLEISSSEIEFPASK